MSAEKTTAKARILTRVLDCKVTSKAQLSHELNLSMPTVLSNVNELIACGILCEDGEYQSTGGRKARMIALNPDYRYAMGIDITANHIAMVLINLVGEVLQQERIRIPFSTSVEYYTNLGKYIEHFLEQSKERDKVIGIGYSLPGIIQRKEKILVQSHTLQLEHYSLKMFEQVSPYPVAFENDANAAMLAENPRRVKNAIYLALNNTLGGSMCINGKMYVGKSKKAGEFGHMILVPGGKQCYCGKKGCADAYCAASVLTHNGQTTVADFMNRIGDDAQVDQIWMEYLDYLAILISNLRMAYDTDIILGGDVGGYLEDYNGELGKRLFQYNLFDSDLSYLKYGSYRQEASAVGVAKCFFDNLISLVS